MRGRSADILVAGCGTGFEAAMLAMIFPDATIAAVDLSRASLAYASVKAREHGLANLAFRQGDILKLGATGSHYDYIASTGVLHHMQEPFEGWKVLRGMLKPDGLMRIGLYSETGRKAVAAAETIIRSRGYTGAREDMLRFRRESPALCDSATLQTLTRLRDYYHLSMYRDLLFHVQERRFDMPEIENMLNRLSLSFEGFHVTPDVLAAYLAAYPADAEAKSLPNWRVFEQRNPATFLSMYTFWCRPKD